MTRKGGVGVGHGRVTFGAHAGLNKRPNLSAAPYPNGQSRTS